MQRVRDLVREIGCPTVAPDLGAERWLALMQVDKKTEGGEIRFVLMPRIGQALSRAAPEADVRTALERNHAMNKDGTVVLMNELASYASDPSKRAGAGTASRRQRIAPSSSATGIASSIPMRFRRLEYKTQVFVNHEGDLFHTA